MHPQTRTLLFLMFDLVQLWLAAVLIILTIIPLYYHFVLVWTALM